MLLVALLVVALSPAYAEQPTSGISFAQVSFTGEEAPESYSHYGQVFIDYTMLYGDGYINVERYDGGKAAGWVVQNIPVRSGSVLPGFSTMFDLGASGYQSSFTAYVDFSPIKLADDSSLRAKAPMVFLLAQAQYPALAPAPANFDLQRIRQDNESVGKECPNTTTLITWGKGDVNPDHSIKSKEDQTKDGRKTVCLQNFTGVTWTNLRFTVDRIKKPKVVTGKDDLLKKFFKNPTQPCTVDKQLGVEFSGTNNGDQKGIPSGTTFKVRVDFPFLKDQEYNYTIYPASDDKKPPACEN